MNEESVRYTVFGDEPGAGWVAEPTVELQAIGATGVTAEFPQPFQRLAVRSDRSGAPPRRRTLRRFQGILVETQGDDARVLLVEGERRAEYWLPAAPLQKAGIAARNQPFEMDEFAIDEADGSYATGYRYRACATRRDAFADTIEFGPEREEKLRAILRKSGHAPG